MTTLLPAHTPPTKTTPPAAFNNVTAPRYDRHVYGVQPPAAPTAWPASPEDLAAAESLPQPTPEQVAGWPDVRHQAAIVAERQATARNLIEQADRLPESRAAIKDERRKQHQRIEAAQREIAAAEAILANLDSRAAALDRLEHDAQIARETLASQTADIGKLLAEYDGLIRRAEDARREACTWFDRIREAQQRLRDTRSATILKRQQAANLRDPRPGNITSQGEAIAKRLIEEANAADDAALAAVESLSEQQASYFRREKVCRLEAGAVMAKISAAIAAP
jgi:chromosome segregation ATPase